MLVPTSHLACALGPLPSPVTIETYIVRALGLPEGLGSLQHQDQLTHHPRSALPSVLGDSFTFLRARLHIANDVYYILCSIPRHFVLGDKHHY